MKEISCNFQKVDKINLEDFLNVSPYITGRGTYKTFIASERFIFSHLPITLNVSGSYYMDVLNMNVESSDISSYITGYTLGIQSYEHKTGRVYVPNVGIDAPIHFESIGIIKAGFFIDGLASVTLVSQNVICSGNVPADSSVLGKITAIYVYNDF